MSLKITKGANFPEHATKLSKDDAISHQFDLINKWKNKKDTWTLRYNPVLISGMSLISAVFLNNHFRYKCRLLNYGRFATYMPTASVPMLLSIGLHHKTILSEVVLRDNCNLCLAIKSAIIQASIGLGLPLLTAPAASYWCASKINSIDIPIVTDYKAVFKLLKKQLRPIRSTLYFLLAFNVIGAALVTYFEDQNMINMEKKYQQVEQILEQNYNKTKALN